VSISRLNALLTSYLFLLWFDTRSGYQDTGPYELPDGRTLLNHTTIRKFGVVVAQVTEPGFAPP